jgi:hypothetical protein
MKKKPPQSPPLTLYEMLALLADGPFDACDNGLFQGIEKVHDVREKALMDAALRGLVARCRPTEASTANSRLTLALRTRGEIRVTYKITALGRREIPSSMKRRPPQATPRRQPQVPLGEREPFSGAGRPLGFFSRLYPKTKVLSGPPSPNRRSLAG